MLVLLSLLATASAARPSMRAPRDSVTVQVKDVAPMQDGHVVFLTDSAEVRVVPVQVGAGEAIAVAFRLAKRSPERPLTHDLLESVAAGLDARLLQVHIHSFTDGVFRARITYQAGRRRLHLDARASDAVVLALGATAPIYLDQRVYEDAGVDVSELRDLMDEAGRPQRR